MRHAQSSVNKIQNGLIAVMTAILWKFIWKKRHLSSVEKKSPSCWQLKDLAATHTIIFNWNKTGHHSMNFKSAWQLSELFFTKGCTTSVSVEKRVTELLTAERPGCNLYHLIQTGHDQSVNYKKCLTAVGISCKGMRNELSSVEKKVTELLAAEHLVNL